MSNVVAGVREQDIGINDDISILVVEAQGQIQNEEMWKTMRVSVGVKHRTKKPSTQESSLGLMVLA